MSHLPWLADAYDILIIDAADGTEALDRIMVRGGGLLPDFTLHFLQ